jgi:hypothetical protein
MPLISSATATEADVAHLGSPPGLMGYLRATPFVFFPEEVSDDEIMLIEQTWINRVGVVEGATAEVSCVLYYGEQPRIAA